VSFAILSDLVPPDWISSGSDLSCRLSSKHILDGQQFVEKLKLLLGFQPLIAIKLLSVELKC
jgi:hypothetical protein